MGHLTLIFTYKFSGEYCEGIDAGYTLYLPIHVSGPFFLNYNQFLNSDGNLNVAGFLYHLVACTKLRISEKKLAKKKKKNRVAASVLNWCQDQKHTGITFFSRPKGCLYFWDVLRCFTIYHIRKVMTCKRVLRPMKLEPCKLTCICINAHMALISQMLGHHKYSLSINGQQVRESDKS